MSTEFNKHDPLELKGHLHDIALRLDWAYNFSAELSDILRDGAAWLDGALDKDTHGLEKVKAAVVMMDHLSDHLLSRLSFRAQQVDKQVVPDAEIKEAYFSEVKAMSDGPHLCEVSHRIFNVKKGDTLYMLIIEWREGDETLDDGFFVHPELVTRPDEFGAASANRAHLDLQGAFLFSRLAHRAVTVKQEKPKAA